MALPSPYVHHARRVGRAARDPGQLFHVRKYGRYSRRLYVTKKPKYEIQTLYEKKKMKIVNSQQISFEHCNIRNPIGFSHDFTVENYRVPFAGAARIRFDCTRIIVSSSSWLFLVIFNAFPLTRHIQYRQKRYTIDKQWFSLFFFKTIKTYYSSRSYYRILLFWKVNYCENVPSDRDEKNEPCL